MLTGDPDFYKKIIAFMGALPERYVERFEKSYAEAFNRLVCDFTNYFCNKDGSINWDEIVEFNSASLDRLEVEKETECRQRILALMKENPAISKKAICEKLDYSRSLIEKTISAMIAEKRLSKNGKQWQLMDVLQVRKPSENEAVAPPFPPV